MNSAYRDYLKEEFDIDERVIDYVSAAEESLEAQYKEADEVAGICQLKVLKAFQDNHINATHFDWSTGYGYDDVGRDAVEGVYASVFNTESALVRPNIVNGTHAIAISLLGLLAPHESLIEISGSPYDTLKSVIGDGEGEFSGTLTDYDIDYSEIPLSSSKDLDFDAISTRIKPGTRMVAIQRSTGYDFRPAISLESIKKAVAIVKSINPSTIIMIDNCYGEFTDVYEPTDCGADVMAGSLIKNPGGGLALSGGYIAGRSELIDKISYRLTCPGIGAECGLTYGQNRNVLQGLFMAPKVVNAALRGAMLAGKVYNSLGFEVMPEADSKRSDIIQAIKFQDPDKMLAFCRAIQAASPIDSYVYPEPWDMPGYKDKVVMASGSFVQGSSIELSSDAPMREPYIAYFQGGLTYEHSLFGIIKSLNELYKSDLVKI